MHANITLFINVKIHMYIYWRIDIKNILHNIHQGSLMIV